MKNFPFNFVIITPGRSGSEHLRETLNFFDDIQIEGEIFNRSNYEKGSLNEFSKNSLSGRVLSKLGNREKLSRFSFNKPLQQLIKKFIASKSSAKAGYGFKISLDQLYAYPFVLKTLLDQNVLLIYLYRKDRLAQVLSMLNARHTGIYHVRKTGILTEKAQFDPDVVLEEYKSLMKYEKYFRKKTIYTSIVEIAYEDLFDDYEVYIDLIRSRLNIPKIQLRDYSDLRKQNPPLESWVSNLDQLADTVKKYT